MRQDKRVADRADGASRASNRVSGDVLLLREVRQLREILTSFVDSYRAVVGCTSPTSRWRLS